MSDVPRNAPVLPFFALATARGWTRAELAYRMGLSVEALDSLRVGRRRPGYRVIRGLVRAFPECSLEKLLGDAIAA